MDDRCQSEGRPVGGGQSLFLSQLKSAQHVLSAGLKTHLECNPLFFVVFYSEHCCLSNNLKTSRKTR